MNPEPLFGKFKTIECFKKDDSMAVYLAHHTYLNKKIILKTLNITLIPDPIVLERFKREARLLAQIDHPNIITVYDFGESGDFFYISFEYFEGQNLREALKNNQWSIEDKSHIVRQICNGLVHTHNKKIIHRDLKPENILINEKKHVKIADFGLAQISGAENLTAPETVIGTPAYMAPEQIQGIKTDERTDLFALGIIIYEIYFSQNPFLGKDAGQTLNNIQKCKRPPTPKRDDVPGFLPKLIDNLLKKKKNERIQTTSEVLKYFDTTGQSETIIAPSPKPYKWGLFLVLAILFLLFIYNDNLLKNDPTLPMAESHQSDSLMEVADSVKQENTRFTQREKIQEKIIEPELELAIKSKTKIENSEHDQVAILKYGFLTVKCTPWAELFIDTKKIDTTPIKKPIRLATGTYFIELKHPDYPTYSDSVTISGESEIKINIDLNNYIGYLKCNVFPWGNIFIDGTYKGQTPLKNNIILSPGKHNLEIRNPALQTYNSEIFITKAETLAIAVELKGANK